MDFNLLTVGVDDDLSDSVRNSLRQAKMEDGYLYRTILLQVEKWGL